MNTAQIKHTHFDYRLTAAMGHAFDRACRSLGPLAKSTRFREYIAQRIILEAIRGETSPDRLYSLAITSIKPRRRGDNAVVNG